MKLSEFVKAPRNGRLFDWWSLPGAFPSPVGAFSVELFPDVGEPDQVMVERAKTLLEFIQSHQDQLTGKVFEHYQRLCSEKQWLLECGVPDCLGPTELAVYLKERSLTVSRDENNFVRGVIYISPQWDAEHGIYMEIIDNELEFCDP